MTLTTHHYAMLHTQSAITDEVLKARGYVSIDDPRDVQDLGFTKAQARTAPVLAVPLWDVHGHQSSWQIRPDSPRQMKDGKVFKYETPKGGRLQLDVHPSVQPMLGDPQVPLWITEGVRKGDALVSHGACTIALMGGVWGFRGTNAHGGKVILPDWEYVALNGRLVYVAYDSDLATKKGVQAALDALWRFLRDRQALPARVQWPEAYQQKKWGVDDFLAEGKTLEDLLTMIPPVGPLPATPPRDAPPADDDALPYSDYTNALALVREHGQDMRYCYAWKSWLTWQEAHWAPDMSGVAIRAAKQTVKQFPRKVEHMDDERKIAALFQHVKSSLAMAKLKAMVECAESEPGIPVMPEDFDKHPFLLNCTNGTLDLSTGVLREHRREDLLTKCLPIPYEPDAPCSEWKAFLFKILRENQDLIAFLQRAIGYSLTGDCREQCLFMLYGTGANGKSTLLEVLQALLGDYAQSTPSSTLLVKQGHESIPNDIARLRGARFVSTVEIGEGKRLNEELLKRLTGQDTLTGRFLHAEFFDFHGEFKLWIACNHRPIIQGTDHAMQRRIKLIPFEVTIPEQEQDKTLPAKLQAELPGILAWAVRGCRSWQSEGLGTTDAVTTATQGYFDAMDTIGHFIEEICTVAPYAKVKASLIYKKYQDWCTSTGEEWKPQRTFGMSLTDRQFIRKHEGTGDFWHGIGLPAPEKDG